MEPLDWDLLCSEVMIITAGDPVPAVVASSFQASVGKKRPLPPPVLFPPPPQSMSCTVMDTDDAGTG